MTKEVGGQEGTVYLFHFRPPAAASEIGGVHQRMSVRPRRNCKGRCGLAESKDVDDRAKVRSPGGRVVVFVNDSVGRRARSMWAMIGQGVSRDDRRSDPAGHDIRISPFSRWAAQGIVVRSFSGWSGKSGRCHAGPGIGQKGT